MHSDGLLADRRFLLSTWFQAGQSSSLRDVIARCREKTDPLPAAPCGARRQFWGAQRKTTAYSSHFLSG
eukprot:2359261-Pyramimonas_sp.AAC.2